jgi:hypothetical protein
MSDDTGFTFTGRGLFIRADKFVTKAGKDIITLILEVDGRFPQKVPIKVFGRLAETAGSLKPGEIVEVTGRLGGRDWNGKVYGDIVAETVEAALAPTNGSAPVAPIDDPGSIPF